MKHAELAARLDAAADRLTGQVLAEMYGDPFWHARFGERADRHGKADGRFHIDYMIQALHAGDPEVMANYARWLQQVLNSRGMCTRHLDDNFRLLAAAIDREGWSDGAAAADVLAVARTALHHADVHAREIQKLAPTLARAIVDELGDPGPYLSDDLVCYAADAIALNQPAVFAAHVAWLTTFLAARGTPADRVAQALRSLIRAAETIAPSAAERVHAVVDLALEATAP